MSQNPLIPAKPAKITLDTLPELFAHWRAQADGMTMTVTPPEPAGPPAPAPPAPPTPPPTPNAPERPDGVTEEEWNAIGDPGRGAIVREREARQAAERALAASRARPTPPKPDPPKGEKAKDEKAKDGEVDIAAIVQQAVAAAVRPFAERDEQREADEAAGRVRDAVLKAAQPRFHDSTDALASIDLTTVLDGNGQPDSTKIDSAISDLLTRKPHLGKVVDDRRFAQPGAGPTPGGSTPPLNDRVKATLARMQERAGVKFADS